MPSLVDIDPAGRYFCIRNVGQPSSVREMHATRAALLESGQLRAGMCALVDLRDMQPGDGFTYADLRGRVDEWRDMLGDQIPRVALLAAPGVSFGIARMVDAMVNSPTEFFEDEALALEWLLGVSGAPSS